MAIVGAFFMSRFGGEAAAVASVVAAEAPPEPSRVRSDVGAALIDATIYRDLLTSLQDINKGQLETHKLLGFLIEVVKEDEQKALRENIREDFKDEMRQMRDQFSLMMSTGGLPRPSMNRP